MGQDESRMKGVPSLQVIAFMKTFDMLSPRDQLHALQLLDEDELVLRATHAYFKVDIPYDEWVLFAEPGVVWKVSLLSINRWKTIRPHIKGFAVRKDNAAMAICFSEQYVTLPFTEEGWALIVSRAPNFSHYIMVEANGLIKTLPKFLRDGPNEPSVDLYSHNLTFEDWFDNDKSDVVTCLADLKALKDWGDDNDDSSSDDATDAEVEIDSWEQERLDKWDQFVASLTT